MDQCRHLLDAPAPEVVGELIEEIRGITTENVGLREVMNDLLEACQIALAMMPPSLDGRWKILAAVQKAIGLENH